MNFSYYQVRLGKLQPYVAASAYKLDRQIVVDEDSGEVFVVRDDEEMYFEEFREAVMQLSPRDASVVIPRDSPTATQFSDAMANTDSNLAKAPVTPMLPRVQEVAITSLSAAQWNLLADVFGQPAHVRSSVEWFEDMLAGRAELDEKAMLGPFVDTFAASHQHASGRFTCWDQSQNRR